MLSRFRAWRLDKVRLLEFGKERDNYIRYSPDFGFSHSWPRGKGRDARFRRRIRYAKHHGCQIVEWRNSRWVVTRQVFGASKVIGGDHLVRLSPNRRK